MIQKAASKSLLIPILICAIASSFYIYDFVVRVMPEAMMQPLMRDFGVNAKGLGILASLFFWGYAPMQIPCGMLFDRYSPRKLLTITIFFSAVSVVIFSFSQTVLLASISRFVLGFMTSFAFVGALVVGAAWFRGQYFAFYTGLVQFLGCMGAVIGITPVSILTDNMGWRNASLLLGVIGFLLAILVWLLVKDAPRSEDAEELHVYPFSAYKKSFTHAQTWWVALFGFAIWAPITIFATTWGASYLTETYHFSQVEAGNYVSTIWWTIAFGGPTVGWLSKRFRSRRWPMWICSLTGMSSAALIVFVPELTKLQLIGCLIGYGIGASALVIAFGLVVDIQPPKAVGAMVGLTNMSVIFAGLTLVPLVGFIMDHLWNGLVVNGVPIHSYHEYRAALSMLPLCFLLAFLTSFLVKETHCEQRHEY